MLQAGIFTAVTLGVFALLATARRAPVRARLLQRMNAEFHEAPARVANSPLYKNLDALDGADEKAPGRPRAEAEAAAPSGSVRRRIEALLRGGTSLPVGKFLALSAGVGVAVGAFALVFAGPIPALVVAPAAAAAPLAVVVVRRNRRRESYLKQLAGAFELMARVLRAGQSVPEAFRAAAEAFDDPLSEEFGRCMHQIEHGLRPEAAFRELAQRGDILELRIFVVAMTIQRQTGGNLSDVLERLAAVIRARIKMRQRIRMLTAEGRMQSLVLTVLPLMTFGVMFFVNRPYAEALLAQGRLLLLTLGCMVVGTLWIRNIMNFEG